MFRLKVAATGYDRFRPRQWGSGGHSLFPGPDEPPTRKARGFLVNGIFLPVGAVPDPEGALSAQPAHAAHFQPRRFGLASGQGEDAGTPHLALAMSGHHGVGRWLRSGSGRSQQLIDVLHTAMRHSIRRVAVPQEPRCWTRTRVTGPSSPSKGVFFDGRCLTGDRHTYG